MVERARASGGGERRDRRSCARARTGGTIFLHDLNLIGSPPLFHIVGPLRSRAKTRIVHGFYQQAWPDCGKPGDSHAIAAQAPMLTSPPGACTAPA